MKIKEFATITGAARIYNIPQATLYEAVAAGKIRRHELADGTTVVRLADVRRWRDGPRLRGRPKSGGTTRKRRGKGRRYISCEM